MISLYKRFVIWTCHILTYIPGYKHYGRFMERQYKERFWTTFAWNVALSILVNIGLVRLTNWYFRKYLETNDLPEPSHHWDGFTYHEACGEWHHPNFPPAECVAVVR